MPSTKFRKKRSSPLGVPRQGQTSPQINGLYVHSSPPKVLQTHPSVVRQWMRAGDLKQLEHMILEGQGSKLIGEYSPDPKVRAFIKQVPALVKIITEAHDAVTKGDMTQLQQLIETKFVDSSVKNILMSKDQAGMTILHKAAYYGYTEIVEFLISKFPSFVNVRDRIGKTPLHYCGASKEAGKIWPILTKAGGDVKIMDSRGKLPSYYMERSNEIQLPDERTSAETISNFNSDKSNLIIKPSNIRIWIHDRDLRKLQRVIWEGHGGKLRVETSNHPKVKRFLEGVPYILNVIKDVHTAVINDDFEEFVKRSSPPAPLEVLESKDIYGLNPLHKAAGLGRLKIAKYILNRNPTLVFSVDHKGKTPLHYAAALKNDNAMYDLLLANNSDENAFDNNNKTPPYYKENTKEILINSLETVPEAPRISQTFPPTWDWSLFQTNASVSATKTSVPKINLTIQSEHDTIKSFQNEKNAENEPLMNTKGKTESPFMGEDQVQAKEEQTEKTKVKQENNDESLLNENDEESAKKGEQYAVGTNRNDNPEKEAKDNPDETFDIWTNEDDSKGTQSFKRENQNYGEDVDEREEDSNGLQVEENAEKMEGSYENESFVQPYQSYGTNDENSFDETDVIRKTEREIAEERQRLLDEGILYIGTEDEEIGEEDKKLSEIIEAEDLEKLASLVIDGDGNKLLGKSSKNPEIQNFLDKLPLYMAKITAVHQAARNGSLRDLQAALDRRKFAIAKESSNKLGATPLHVAVLFGKTNIVKYLGGRFPETLNYKDNFGRTPLHYAATLPDNGYFSNILQNLGSDGTIKDDAGHTPVYYQDNPEELSHEKLLKDFGSPTMSKKSRSRDLEHPLLNVGDENIFTNGVSSPITDPSVHDTEPEVSFDEGMPVSRLRSSESVNDANDPNDYSLTNFTATDRDEYGQSILHFAAARAHGRNGLFQLIQESNVNLGFRDELYRTARDIALQANIPENIDEIDKYVISLAARGETEKLIELFLEGYDHILDLEDDEDNDVVTIAKNKNHQKTVAFLKAIPSLEDKREKILKAIRAGDDKLVHNIMEESKNGRFIVVSKNVAGRCSLHTAVLCQQKEIAEMISQKYPETLRVGDNLERTPLHYAMGVEEVETLSKILIKCGAKRVLKDLKGRQPTYYFMNRSEILKLQEEENSLRE